MSEQNDQFTPESVDEQIRLLTHAQQMQKQQPEEALIHDLHTIYGEYVETRERVWLRLQQHLREQEAQNSTPEDVHITDIQEVRVRKKRVQSQERLTYMETVHPSGERRSRYPFLWAACVVLLLVGSMLWLFSSVHYRPVPVTTGGIPDNIHPVAVSPVINHDCPDSYTAWQRLCKAHQLQPINQGRAFMGMTFTLETVYVDGVNAIVQYMASPVTNASQLAHTTLATSLVLPSGERILSTGAASLSTKHGQGYEWIETFDMSTISFASGIYPLKMVIVKAGEPDTATMFNFSAVFHPTRIADLQQAVTANDIPITLRSIRVAPSQTTIHLGIPPEGLSPRITNDGSLFSLSVGKKIVNGTWNVGFQNEGNTITTSIDVNMSIDESLVDLHGEWTLRVSHLAKNGGTTDWVFHFTVPDK